MEENNNIEVEVTIRLLDLMKKTNYDLVQENGQRRLTAPELTPEMKEQIKGAEIFLGRLPRDCYEDEIAPILQNVGRFLELRLMLDFSGSTRGYAFALFENATIARRACQLLDGHEIRPGHRIGVVKSIDNCRLFFGGVPKDKSKDDFMEELGKMLDGITDIYMYPSAENKLQNRGFIFVEFKDHRSAAMARRKLIPGRVVLWNHEIAVDWADPEPGEPIDDEVMETVTALFVRNLPLDIQHQQLRYIFQETTGVKILKLKKINHFAFIHYETRQLAQCVLDIMTKPGGVAEKYNWEIRWAKPIESSKMVKQRSSGSVENRPILSQKMSTNNKRHKVTNRGNHKNSDVNVDYPQLLQSFVAEKLGAACHFQCYQVNDGKGFICRVTVVRESYVLFEIDGNHAQNERQAMKNAARKIYISLQETVNNQQLNFCMSWNNSQLMPNYNALEVSR